MAPATSSDKEGRPYDVFLSHAGEEKLRVVSHIRALFCTAYPQVAVFVDDWSLKPGQRAMPNIFRALDECAVIVVVLSQAFVRKRWPMDEVTRIRKRLDNKSQEESQKKSLEESQEESHEESVRVIWVGFDITYAELDDLQGRVYSKAGGPVVDPKLDKEQAHKDMKWLLDYTGQRRDQDARQAESELVARVVDDAVEALRAVRGLQPYESQEQLLVFGRDKNVAELNKMREAGAFVVLYGPSGMGKTTLATSAYEQFAPEYGAAASAVHVKLLLREAGGSERKVLSLQREFMVGALRCTELEVASCSSPRDRRAAIAARLKGKRLLLLLDDAQSPEQLAELLPIELLSNDLLRPGSLVLVTARTADVVREFPHRCLTTRSAPARLRFIQEYPVGPLTDLHDCRRLFCWHTFQTLELPRDLASLEVQLSKAVEQCKQLPPVLVLAASQVATLARRQQAAGRLRKAAFETAFNRLARVQLSTAGKSPLLALELIFQSLEPCMQSMLLDVAIYFRGQPWQLAWQYCDALVGLSLQQSGSLDAQDMDELPFGLDGLNGLDGLKDMALVCQTWVGPVALVTVHDFVMEFCKQKVASATEGKRLAYSLGRKEELCINNMWSSDVVCLRVSQAQQLPLPAARPPAPLKHRLIFIEEARLLEDAREQDGPAGILQELVHVRLQDVAPQRPAAWLLRAACGAALRVVELHRLPVIKLDLQALDQVEYSLFRNFCETPRGHPIVGP